MSLDNIFSNTSATHILGLLQDNAAFAVPRFQQGYSWGEGRVSALWDDLVENYKESKDGRDPKDIQYMLGPVVLARTERHGVFSVIDGQQRLATLTMLFCAGRNIILDEVRDGDAEIPEDLGIIKGLIQHTSGGRFAWWKLELNDTDRDAFRKIQEYDEYYGDQGIRISEIASRPPSLGRLKRNYGFLHDRLADSLDTCFDGTYAPGPSAEQDGDWRVGMLMDFLTHVAENSFVIKIMVERHSTAFQILEALGEHGQPRARSDLIKDHVMQMAGGEGKELSSRWDGIFGEITGSGQRDDDFIMESYRSRYRDPGSLRSMGGRSPSPMSRKNIYGIIKDMTTAERECTMLVEELAADARSLSALYDPSRHADARTRGDIAATRQLKVGSIRAPLLAAYRRWHANHGADKYSRLARLFTKFIFKSSVVMQQDPRMPEKIMAEMTGMINSGKSLDSIIARLREHDRHGEFLRSFPGFMKDGPTRSAAKYALSEIAVQMGAKHSDVQPIDGLALEHILPRNFRGMWDERAFLDGHAKDDRMQDFVARLGNMTLLHDAIGTGVQNNPFSKKLEYYRGSDLELNRAICRLPRWTAAAIEEREGEFERHADKIWALD